MKKWKQRKTGGYLILCLLLLATNDLNAQSFWDYLFRSYFDGTTAGSVGIEAMTLKAVDDRVGETRKEVLKAAAVATIIESSKVAFPAPPPLIISPLDPNIASLCDGFWNPLNPEQQRCQRKRDYLLECSRIMDRLFSTGTRYDITRGQRDLIMQQYNEIDGMLNAIVVQMQIERDKRTLARRIFD